MDNKIYGENNYIEVDRDGKPLIYNYKSIYNLSMNIYSFVVTNKYKYCLETWFNFWNVFDIFEIVKRDMLNHPSDYDNIKEPIIFINYIDSHRNKRFKAIGRRLLDYIPVIENTNENLKKRVDISEIYSRKTNKQYVILSLKNHNNFIKLFDNFVKTDVKELYLIDA